MAKNRFKGFGGGLPNMNNLMKQAKQMQDNIAKAQEELEALEVDATAGGGAVSVIFSGKKELKEITIKPEVIDPDDAEMLQDLILAAINEGLRKADELSESKMSATTGGMGGGLPGLF